MPAGTSSLQPYQSTVYATDSASVYKGKLDANASIAGNVAGQFYVYPQNPASMAVNIDVAWNILQIGNSGSSVTIQPTASPATLTLTAPGSSTYYGTVYYNTNTATFAVAYGTLGGGITFPTSSGHWPIAAVLLAAGQTSIQASNIYDLRGLSLIPKRRLGTVTGTSTVDCTGATDIQVVITINTSSVGLTLTNLMLGTMIDVIAFNSTGANANFSMATYSTTGASVSCLRMINNGAPPSFGTAVTLTTGQVYRYSGHYHPNGNIYLTQS